MEFNSLKLFGDVQFLWGALCFLLLFGHLIAQRALGQCLINCFTPPSRERVGDFAIEWVIGVLAYCGLLLLVKCLGIAWGIAIFFPYLLLLFHRDYASWFVLPNVSLNWNRSLWYLTHAIIGLSIFTTVQGSIATPWKNAYGDLPFHLGMISSFVHGDLFPSEYFIFAGETLSYPFMINLWSASLWFFQPTWFVLSCIFAYQWFLLWGAVYECCDGDRSPMIPWVLLFGGGCFFALSLGGDFSESGKQIAAGYGWTNFITTIWIPQRSSVFGLAASLVALKLFFLWDENRVQRGAFLALSGLVLGLSPLVHTHFGLVTGLFISFSLFYIFISSGEKHQIYLQQMGVFWGVSLLSLTALPFLLGKESLLALEPFSFFAKHNRHSTDVLVLFLKNFWLPLSLAGAMWFTSRLHKFFIPLLFVFLLAWLCKVSIWEWDQVKLYIACYCILGMIWSRMYSSTAKIFILFFPLLLFPTSLELSQIFYRGNMTQIFSASDVIAADLIRSQTSSDAILAAVPHHNAPAVLSGRRLYSGYAGWLWSHGLPYQKREEALKKLFPAISCTTPPCPDYLIWGQREKNYWKGRRLPAQLLELQHPGVYKVINSTE